jgi:hypothetical protein
MIRKAHTKVDIRKYTSTEGDGGQLQKTWDIRYHDVPMRIVPLSSREATFFYERFKIFADFKGFILYKVAIDPQDRIYFGTRRFQILKIDNWDEQKKCLRIMMTEMT